MSTVPVAQEEEELREYTDQFVSRRSSIGQNEFSHLPYQDDEQSDYDDDSESNNADDTNLDMPLEDAASFAGLRELEGQTPVLNMKIPWNP